MLAEMVMERLEEITEQVKLDRDIVNTQVFIEGFKRKAVYQLHMGLCAKVAEIAQNRPMKGN